MTASMHSAGLRGAGQERPDCRQILAHQAMRGGQHALARRLGQGRKLLLRQSGIAVIGRGAGKWMVCAQFTGGGLRKGGKKTGFGIGRRHLSLHGGQRGAR